MYIYTSDSGNPVSDLHPFPSKLTSAFQNITVVPNASYTVTGNTIDIDCSKYKEAVAFIDVTAASGITPTLDVKFQTQDPVSLEWFDLTALTFTQATAVSTEMKSQSNLLGSTLRCLYTIDGTTPDFTFSVGLVLKS
jgi:hypothetical protein